MAEAEINMFNTKGLWDIDAGHFPIVLHVI